MNQNPAVSIVVPTYNQGSWIEECLRSIQAQTFKNIEVIIQDSESTDQTQAICELLKNEDPRFRYFREKDAGQSDAINRGIKRSNGKYWTWLCSDDAYYSHTSIQLLVNAMEIRKDKPEYVGAYGKAFFMDEESEPIHVYHQKDRDLEKKDFKLDWPLSQPASLLLKSRVEEVGGVYKEQHLGMDLDLFIRMLDQDHKLAYIPRTVASVRVQKDSKSIKFRRKTAENALTIIDKYFEHDYKPKQSAYARELKASIMWEKYFAREEVRLKMLDSLRRNPRSAWMKSMQERAHLILQAELKDLSIQEKLFRGAWRTYQVTKKLVVNWIFTPAVWIKKRKS